MKFTCSICGYVYEEEKEGVPFSELSLDWTCPSCGAQKAMFDPVKVEQPEPSAAEGVSPDVHHELKKLSAGALSLLFSNLARGCEKQYRPAEQKQYLEIAGFFASLARKEKAECCAVIVEMMEDGVPIFNIDDLETVMKAEKPDVAVLTLPKKLAKEMTARLIDAGINGIWNFTNIDLHLEFESVPIEDVHFSESLMTLTYRLKEKQNEKN